MSPLILLVLALAVAAYYFANRFYGPRLERAFGIEPERPTPAHTRQDGRDFIPARPSVLFAHHFAAIAGAGPIIGPTLALAYGLAPGLIWVIVGAIFLGGAHDLMALLTSVREKGESIAVIARRVLGPAGYGCMVAFLLVSLFMINATFLNLSVTALTSSYPAVKVGLPEVPRAELEAAVAAHPGEGLVPFVVHPWMPTQIAVKEVPVQVHDARAPGDGARAAAPVQQLTLLAKIGGIASTSVFIITLAAPLLGWMIYRRQTPGWLNYSLAAVLCVGSVALGLKHPVVVSPEIWRWIMTSYVVLASAIPVWLLLMPRDFVNVQILYGGILAVFAALLTLGFGLAWGPLPASAPHTAAEAVPLLNWVDGIQYVGWFWPLLCITISCGAISGFHCLVSTGTTAKQLAREDQARPVVYRAMLLESLLAVTVILTLYAGLSQRDYLQIAHLDKNPILAISLATGNLFHHAFAMPVWFGTVVGILLLEGFVVTSLDAAVRLARYLFEELWRTVLKHPPSWLLSPWINTGITVAGMFALSKWNTLPVLWRVFGTANQMMGALALLVVAVWLRERGRPTAYALVPSVLMFATTLTSAFLAFRQNLAAGNVPLMIACALLASLAVAMIALAVRRWRALAGSDRPVHAQV